MIKFFRNIRKKLLAEGKTTNYLKYAIGEIILVVIGILIALQINNWNENRKDRMKEKTILSSLNKEFEKNLEQFNTVKQLHLNNLRAQNIVLRNIDKLDKPKSIDSVSKYALGIFGGITFNPSNGIVQSLISSGDINIITNDTLKNYLVSWKDVLDDYTEEEIISKEFWSNVIEPYIIKNGDFRIENSQKNFRLLKDSVFINMIVRKHSYTNNIITEIDDKNSVEDYLNEIVRLSKTN
ncbi:hypothetical protein GCM10007962_21530 [Yeosuana aromativorans]|uniref:Uncharacterized protein n=1 Tax=Yeosuana aromativorans TaxID=288019 RepID=A0A8J3BQX4_9FLAO|nr:DUF6090 family protein [Yeosuana aromativorans]GGK26946.1 hypothetical protein GCM10007962_21530 [Yeosuana aromativorans]